MIVLTQSYYVHSASFFQCILLCMLLEPYLYTRTKSNYLTIKSWENHRNICCFLKVYFPKYPIHNIHQRFLVLFIKYLVFYGP